MHTAHRFLLSLFLFVSLPLIALAKDLVLIEDGRPRASIVVAIEPSEQATRAASALQTYLQKISGAKLRIHNAMEPVDGPRILVGRSSAVLAAGVKVPSGHTYLMKEEGFVARRVGEDLVLAGNEDWNYRGTTYAVYDFLEHLGCRWFFPGPYGEVLPVSKTIAVGDLDKTERPDFRFRNLWYSGWFPTSATDGARLRDWYDKNKMASLSMSLPGDGSVSRLIPAEQYFETHPHLFALDKKGVRHKDMVCMSQPEGVRISIDTIETTFRNDPKALSFGFAPPDGFPMCHCEDCNSWFPGFEGKGYGDPSLSDLWFQFADKVARGVYDEFPDRWVLTNGYANRVRPPENVSQFSPNLGIQSAVIAACSIHRIGDPRCWQRLHYKQLIDRWTEALDCVFIYDYDPGNSLVNLPFPALHNLKRDIPYFKKRGVWGFWTEGTNTWMVTHLNYYIRAKLMWDAESDVEALVRDYCEKFYGAAAGPIEQYIWLLEEAVENTPLHETWGRLMRWEHILANYRDGLDALIEEAESLANDANATERVGVFRLVHDHMNCYVDMMNAAGEGRFSECVDLGDEMLAFRDTAESIQTGLLPHSPDWVRTFRTSLEWHQVHFQRLADLAGGATGELVTMLPRTWKFKTDPEEVGTLYQWYDAEIDNTWTDIDTTLFWEGQGHADEKGWGYWGNAWYRTDFIGPKETVGRPLRLTLGAVYNQGVWVWVNGKMLGFEKDPHWRLGYHDVRSPVTVDITDLVEPGQSNTVAVLVHTNPPGRNPRSGLHRRSFIWTPKE